MKVALSGTLEGLLKAKAEALGISAQEALRMLAVQWVGSAEGPAWAPAGSLQGPGGTFKEGVLGGGEATLTKEAPKSRRKRLPRVSTVRALAEVLPFAADDLLHVGEGVPAQRAGGGFDGPTPEHGIQRREIRWRTEVCWADYLLCRAEFYREQNGARPGATPTLTADIVKAIRGALLEHDGDRLGPEDRERWRLESPVRAAGCGIFNDPWCAGRHAQNDALTGGGTRYLEPWRPWVRQRGKPDPVPRFAQLYFEIRDAEDAARRVR